MSHLWGVDSSGGESSEDGVEDEEFLFGLEKEPTETNPSSSAKGGQPDINTLISFETLKELKRAKGKKGKGDGESSSESSDGLDIESGATKALRGVSSLRRRLRKKPDKIFKGYVKLCKRVVGVTEVRQVWGFRDLSRRLLKTLGKTRGLWRAHAGLQEIIQYLAGGGHALALAFACQLSKALPQVALDRGSWEIALLLIPMPDALSDPSFGGEEHELAAVQSYRRALRDLKSKQVNLDAGSGTSGTEDGSDVNKKKKKDVKVVDGAAVKTQAGKDDPKK